MKKFIDVYVPTEICNFSCSYCYVSQEETISKQILPIRHEPEEIRKALSKERLGGVCLLNFCGGGETLLGNDILPVIKVLLEEGHYISVVTNGTITKRFEEISKWKNELKRHLFLKFSFHYMELKKRNLLDIFFYNCNLMKREGISISLELMPHDELIPYIGEIKKVSLDKVGALPHVTVGRNNNTKQLKLLSYLSMDEYKKVWGTFHSIMFDFKMDMFGKEQRGFCYAGNWSCSLRIDTGDLFQCNGLIKIDNIYSDILRPITFRIVGNKCPHPHCWNCHSYFALGVMPTIDAPTYREIRDRVCKDGTHWLNQECREFFQQKLSDSNYVLNKDEERLSNENTELFQKNIYLERKNNELQILNDNLQQQIEERLKELYEYKNWVVNLQKQVEDRLKELGEYKNWVNNLQNQVCARQSELEIYKQWVNNLQNQIKELKK